MVNFRKYTTKNGFMVLAGRDSKSNEELVFQVDPNEEVLHTAHPGSPFVNIKGTPKTRDIKEAAIFCARFSRDWKKNGKDVEIHRFKGKDIYKEKGMKQGTFGVKKFKLIKVKKEEIQNWDQMHKSN
jgi:predicted ribosome quality control (RQC) complex YloA/Tae2 family protein